MNSENVFAISKPYWIYSLPGVFPDESPSSCFKSVDATKEAKCYKSS